MSWSTKRRSSRPFRMSSTRPLPRCPATKPFPPSTPQPLPSYSFFYSIPLPKPTSTLWAMVGQQEFKTLQHIFLYDSFSLFLLSVTVVLSPAQKDVFLFNSCENFLFKPIQRVCDVTALHFPLCFWRILKKETSAKQCCAKKEFFHPTQRRQVKNLTRKTSSRLLRYIG